MQQDVIPKVSARKLRQILSVSNDIDEYRRILALLAVHERRPVSDIAAFLHVTRQTVYNWMDLSAEDLLAPSDKPETRGRPPKWTKEIDQLLEAAFNHRPREFGYSAANWTVPLVITHVFNQTGRRFSRTTTRRRLRMHRFGWKRPRYSLAEDPHLEKKEDFTQEISRNLT